MRGRGETADSRGVGGGGMRQVYLGLPVFTVYKGIFVFQSQETRERELDAYWCFNGIICNIIIL